MNQNTFRYSLLIVVALLVVALTTLPASAALVQWTTTLFTIDAHPNLHDAIGHAALYGTLTAVLYGALRQRAGFSRAFVVTLALVLPLALATELAQRFVPGRTVQLSDLLGNWLGILAIALLICFRQATALSRRLPPHSSA